LDLSQTGVADLGVLKQSTALKVLDVSSTRVTDLSPLRGLALQTLILDNTGVSDLTPILSLPLEELHLAGVELSDVTPLRAWRWRA